jgi:hypothetical protein
VLATGKLMPTQSSAGLATPAIRPSNVKSTTVTGVFSDPDGVERAYEVAVARGYEIGDVNVVMSEETRRRFYSEERDLSSEIAKKSAEGGELGGPTGGRVGIAVAIAAAVGAAFVLPGLGFVMAGPLAVALAGAGAAGLAAGLIGALADWGLPDERVLQYQSEISDGRILIGVKTRNAEDARSIAQEWQAIGGQHVHG